MKSRASQTVTLTILRDADGSTSGEGWIQLGGRLQEVCSAQLRDLPLLRGDYKRVGETINELHEAIRDSHPGRLRTAIRKASEWLTPPGFTAINDFESKSLEDLKRAARFDRESLRNQLLSKSRLVFWSKGNGAHIAVPAIYCPDDVTAVFALQFMQRTRLCKNPKCRVPFVLSAGKFYHTEHCAAAHRTQRWRAAKLQRELEASSVR